MFSVKAQPSKIAKGASARIEPVSETQRRRADLIRRLRKANVDVGYLAGLRDCSPDECGRVNCAEGCPYGSRRRRLSEAIALKKLLEKVDGPILELWLTKDVWARRIGDLRKIKIDACTKLLRRGLDKLYDFKVIAVGTVQIRFDAAAHVWRPMVHLVVADADKEDLERALSLDPNRQHHRSYCRISKVNDICATICDVLRRDADGREVPWFHAPPMKRAQRREYYAWTLSLKLGSRLVRYGCDRYFNRLDKKERIRRPKGRKKRPYPVWLEPHMFGNINGRWENVDPHKADYTPKPKVKQTPRRRPWEEIEVNDEYFDLD
jgi:hypothetical protein